MTEDDLVAVRDAQSEPAVAWSEAETELSAD
jgi:hypothetical protein